MRPLARGLSNGSELSVTNGALQNGNGGMISQTQLQQDGKFNPFKTPRDAQGQLMIEDPSQATNFNPVLPSMKNNQFFNLLQLPIPDSLIG
jgi:hypothetical protein